MENSIDFSEFLLQYLHILTFIVDFRLKKIFVRIWRGQRQVLSPLDFHE